MNAETWALVEPLLIRGADEALASVFDAEADAALARLEAL